MTYSEPTVQCSVCLMKRDVMQHQRASSPVDAAKKALKKNFRCTKQCDIKYTAGVDIAGLARQLKRYD